MISDRRFYDTCSLLYAGESVFQSGVPFVVSSITFKELEKIKTSSSKDPDTKYAARVLLRAFEQHPDMYDVIIHKKEYEDDILDASLELSDDTKILSDAIHANYMDNIIFVTNDLSLKHMANLFFGDGMIESVTEEIDDYVGYKEVIADDETLGRFYQDQSLNYFNLCVGEYLVLRNQNNEIVDLRAWTGEEYRFLDTNCFSSKWFGKIAPKDYLQKCALDSLNNNQLTYIGGHAGSGKTYIALGYLFSELEKGRIDQITIFCNPVVAKNAAKLGYYPGSQLEKVLSTQTGNVLSSKLGDLSEVERLVGERKLVIVPAGDARGYQTLPNSGVYIMEAQNYDITLLRMLLQRVDDTSKVICDGDKLEQTDLPIYNGSNNGLKRMSQVFRGLDFYGQVELNTIYRSRIADAAENMK